MLFLSFSSLDLLFGGHLPVWVHLFLGYRLGQLVMDLKRGLIVEVKFLKYLVFHLVVLNLASYKNTNCGQYEVIHL